VYKRDRFFFLFVCVFITSSKALQLATLYGSLISNHILITIVKDRFSDIGTGMLIPRILVGYGLRIKMIIIISVTFTFIWELISCHLKVRNLDYFDILVQIIGLFVCLLIFRNHRD
jgi:hypothetical protein